MAHVGEEFAFGFASGHGGILGLSQFGIESKQLLRPDSYLLLQSATVKLQLAVAFFDFREHLIKAAHQGSEFVFTLQVRHSDAVVLVL